MLVDLVLINQYLCHKNCTLLMLSPIIILSFIYRLDDPLLLERYRLLQHPLAAAAAAYPHPGLIPPQYLSSGGLRGYPPELLAQQLAYLPPGTKLPDHLTSPTAAAAAAAAAADR